MLALRAPGVPGWAQRGTGPSVPQSLAPLSIATPLPVAWGWACPAGAGSGPWPAQVLTESLARAGGPEAHPGLHRAERGQLRGVFEAGAPGTTLGPWVTGREGPEGTLCKGCLGTMGSFKGTGPLVFTGGLCFRKQRRGSVE